MMNNRNEGPEWLPGNGVLGTGHHTSRVPTSYGVWEALRVADEINNFFFIFCLK